MSKQKPSPGGRAKKKTAVSLIRSSAAEYLTFVAASGQGGVEAVYADENVWLTQKMMGVLYDVETHTVNYHLKKIFSDSELQVGSVIRNFRITAADGKTYDTQHYNLTAIIAVGYKVNSERAVQFRKWATGIIHHLAPQGMAGFVLANGSMSSNQSGEGDIRRALIEADLVDCMVALPGQLFYSTQIPVCLWFCGEKNTLDSANDARLFDGETELSLVA